MATLTTNDSAQNVLELHLNIYTFCPFNVCPNRFKFISFIWCDFCCCIHWIELSRPYYYFILRFVFTRHKHLAIVIMLFHPWYLSILCVCFFSCFLFVLGCIARFVCEWVCGLSLFLLLLISCFCLCRVCVYLCLSVFFFNIIFQFVVCTVHFVAHFFLLRLRGPELNKLIRKYQICTYMRSKWQARSRQKNIKKKHTLSVI